MKNIKKKNLAILFACVCFLFSVFVGLFCYLDNRQNTAYAEASAESNLRFTLYNGNQEYKVAAADRQLTEAVIPAYYNGLPVTEVADNAFMSCAVLQTVEIPETVTRIDNNAFYNCRNLQKLVGMINVTEIGNNAFAMCAQLNNLIIPPKVEKLGSSIIRSVTNPVYVRNTQAAMASLNANWNLNSTAKIIYGNDLVCSKIVDENDAITGYSIDPWQVLMPDYDYFLLCSYKYKECNGVECVDPECPNVHSETYYPITNIDKDAFNGNMFNSLTVLYDDEHIGSHYPVNVCSQAFMGIIAETINIEVDITLYDASSDFDSYPEYEKYTSMSVFAGSTVKNITLPDSLDRIPRSTFALCFDLKYLFNTNPYIGANTLSDKITAIDTNAFEFCTSLELLNVPDTVQLIGNAAFDYWGSTDTKQIIRIDLYKSDDSWDKNWTGSIQENATVQFNTMPVVFEKQEGVGGSDTVQVTYGQAMPSAAAPQRIGYDFNGYYSNPKGQGEQYYDENMASVQDWNKISEATILYANWTPKKYNVVLENGLIVAATYSEAMPEAPIPEVSVGHHFVGYKGPNGTIYYNADMTSAHIWDIAEDNVALEAMEEANVYTVNLANDVSVEVVFGKEMPNAPIPTIDKGYSFFGYTYNGTLYYNADMTSAHVWDIAEDNVVLESIQIINDYFVHLNDGITVYVAYGEPMPAAPAPLHVAGRVFTGYSYNGTLYYNADMTSAHVWDIDLNGVTLTYESVELVTKINYVLNGGENNSLNPDSISYNSFIRLREPTKFADLFDGWYLDGYIKVDMLTNIDREEITLTARWLARSVVINPRTRQYIVSGECTFLDVTDAETCEIIINENALQLYIFSDNAYITHNITLTILERSTDFTLFMQDVTIRGILENIGPAVVPNNVARPAIRANMTNASLILNAYGHVSLYGGNGENGIAHSAYANGKNGGAAITCSDLIIQHADDLGISGGEAGSGNKDYTSNGGNGGSAVIAVRIKLCQDASNVFFGGGSGGYSYKMGNPGVGGKAINCTHFNVDKNASYIVRDGQNGLSR